MARYTHQFRAFGGKSIYDFMGEQNQRVQHAVAQLSDDTLFNTDEAELVTRIVQQCRVSSPQLDFDKRSYKIGTAVDYPHYQPVGRNAPTQVIEYTIPAKGDAKLLEIQPQQVQMLGFNGLPEIYVVASGIAFCVADYGGDAQAVANEATKLLDNLRINSTSVWSALEAHNERLPGVVQQAIALAKRNREASHRRDENLRKLLP